jgi:hypothetical protein
MTREEVKELIREVISEELKIDVTQQYYRHICDRSFYKVQLKLGENSIISTSNDNIEIPNPNFKGYN